jgi:hypothetical protein
MCGRRRKMRAGIVLKDEISTDEYCTEIDEMALNRSDFRK